MFSPPRDPLQEYLRSLQPQQPGHVTRWKQAFLPRNLFAGAKALFLELLLLRLVILRIALPEFLMIFILVNALGAEWEVVPMAITWLGLAALALTLAARIRAALKKGPDITWQLGRNLRVLSGWFWVGVLVAGLLLMVHSQPLYQQMIGWAWAGISSLVLAWHCITMLWPVSRNP